MKIEVLSKRHYTYINENFKQFLYFGIPPPRFAYYKVRVTKIFKGEKNISAMVSAVTSSQHLTRRLPYEMKVYTSANDNGCGKYLEKGQKYFISGRITQDKIHLNSCDWSIEWHHLTKSMKHGIHGNYDCRCFVATCIDGYCDRNTGCKWNVTWDKPVDECKMKFASCQRNEKLQSCYWKSDQKC